MESTKLVQTTDRIWDALSLARGMSIDGNISADALIDLMARRDQATAQKSHDQERGGIVNPWGGLIGVSVWPQQLIQFDATVSPSVCRRLMMFYGNDAPAVGLREVEVQDYMSKASPRQVYLATDAKTEKRIEAAAFDAGCGDERQVVLSLTFRLR